ncbi:tyrosyl-DNA phosphodiesterase 1 isoform X5 [Juglans microcarpa x Juglans regia]|uniref:tyrosyl-DNA phosphodiesterase 1 isoform X5 n=1 Tax=Juglans microcarpa x Juglans regia TaxID=2249226 RepID=UPI001B7E6CA9|nr:tyrosyl-DNA phosphodiesterase 1 isoform X5 [Juglans microcarpa x Juglans regia]
MLQFILLDFLRFPNDTLPKSSLRLFRSHANKHSLMAQSQIGYLVPLMQNLVEDASIPKLTLSEGANLIGRNNLPVPDKRLSRKHITLTASADGSSANLFVEGTNPIVVNSGNKRRKLCSQESATISDGAIIELIPGHHFFKYVSSGGDENAPLRQTHKRNEAREFGKGEEPCRRRPHQTSERISFGTKSQIGNSGHSQSKGESNEMAIRHFHVSNDKLPWTFRLLQVKELPAWANTSCVSLSDVIQGDILIAILSNYMVDINWLLPACPALAKIPHVLVVHGEGDGTLDHMKWPEFSVKLPALGNFNINPTFFRKFDYSNAAVRLIASVPGYHRGTNLKKWGHMKLRTVLQECTFDKEFKKSPLAYQFSSLGSLDEKWLAELASSMSSGFSEDKTPLGLGEPRIIWPTVEDVRCSLEGYAAGNAIPSPLKNVEKEFLKKYWAKWRAGHTGRCRAMPHIKTYTRYNGQQLAWFLLTSANLSKAAWGALQKNNTQLMIRSYELGVLFLPSSTERHGSEFSCTSNGDVMEMYPGLGTGNILRKMFMVKFGHDKYRCILFKIPDIFNVYTRNSISVSFFLVLDLHLMCIIKWGRRLHESRFVLILDEFFYFFFFYA